MARTKYLISLSNSEREALQQIIDAGSEHRNTILRAKILLLSDSSAQRKPTVLELAETLGTTHTTIQTVRTEYAQGGLECALYRKKRVVSTVRRRINDEVVEEIIKLLDEAPPMEYKRWSLRTLCDESVKRGIVAHIAPATMRSALKRFGVDLK